MTSTETRSQAEDDPLKTRSPYEKTWSHGWKAMVIGLLCLLIAYSTAFEDGSGPMDEGTLLVYPEMIQRGAVPYRDFETFYGPANPYLLAAVYTIFGTNIEVERTVGLFYRLVIFIAVFGITRRWGTAIATACMLISGLLLVPLGVVAYAWFGALACALSFVWAMTRPENRWRCLAGGFLAGVALSFRPDVGPAVILAALVLILPLSQSHRLKFALGAGLGLIPFAVVLLLAGPEEVFNNIFLYPVIRSGPARRIPLFAADPSPVRLFYAMVLAVLANIVAGIMAIRAHPAGRREKVFLALALLGAGVMPQAWQRLDNAHVLFVAFLVIGILPLTFFSFVARRNENRKSRWLALGLTAMALVLMAAVSRAFFDYAVSTFRVALQTAPVGSVFLERGSRSFPVGPPGRVVNIGRMLDQIERLSKPGERLFVGPGDLRRTNYCDTFIYHLLPKLRPATYFLEMNPLSANRPGSRLASDVASADWLILNYEWDFANEPNRSVEYGPVEAADVVKNQFQFVGLYGSFALFRRKG